MELLEQIKQDFLDYSYQVNAERSFCAIDGLKPCQRLSLYAMYKNNFTHNKPFVKSAKIVGIVIGEYSPHGDSTTYDCIAKMTQDFNNNLPLCELHGNGGSLSDPTPAAYRYTEVRLSEFGEELFENLENSVPFVDNFDNSTKQPLMLPTPFPLLLINGCSGVGVTLSTNILPYNFTEVTKAYKNFLKTGKMDYTLIPDFPTGGKIIDGEFKKILKTGKGKVVVQATSELEQKKRQIIFTELCYLTNVKGVFEKLKELINKGAFPEIKNIQNATGKDGVRLIVEYKKGVRPEELLDKLYKKTDLQKNYTVNQKVLIKKTPRLLSTKEYFEQLYGFQDTYVKFRCKNELLDLKDKIEKAKGLIFAQDNIESIVRIMKKSKGKKEAKNNLMQTFDLTQIQAESIVVLPLYKINKLDKENLQKEYDKLLADYNLTNKKISNKDLRKEEIIERLDKLLKKYKTKRKTQIVIIDNNSKNSK